MSLPLVHTPDHIALISDAIEQSVAVSISFLLLHSFDDMLMLVCDLFKENVISCVICF